MTTSGRSWPAWATARPPSVTTSTSFTWRLGAEQAAHVLGDLGHVLDQEQADGTGGTGHQADDTTLNRVSRHRAIGR